MTKARKNQTAAPSTFDLRIAQLRAHRLAETSKDMIAVLGTKSSPFQFDAGVNAQIDAWGIDTAQIFAPDRNPKAIKRFIQFTHAVLRGDYKNVDRSTALGVYALHLAGAQPLNRDALRYLAARIKDADKVQHVDTKGISRMRLSKLIGSVNTGTIDTQLSRTFGAQGFLTLAGACTTSGGKNALVTMNPTHPMVRAFINMIDKATAQQFDQIIAGKGAE